METLDRAIETSDEKLNKNSVNPLLHMLPIGKM